MNNTSNNIRVAQAKVNQAITQLTSAAPAEARALRALFAQAFGGDGGGAGQQTFDLGTMGAGPGQAPGAGGVMPFRDDAGDGAGDPGAGPQDSGSDDNGGGLHPGIDSYVRPPHGGGPENMVDDRKTHKCAVTFKAPPGVGEDEMMNYILGIGKALGVDVESFNWSKTEAKPSGGATGMR